VSLVSFADENVYTRYLVAEEFNSESTDSQLNAEHGVMLIETQELITYPLYLLFKKSLKDTVIPDDWKQAIRYDTIRYDVFNVQ